MILIDKLSKEQTRDGWRERRLQGSLPYGWSWGRRSPALPSFALIVSSCRELSSSSLLHLHFIWSCQFFFFCVCLCLSFSFCFCFFFLLFSSSSPSLPPLAHHHFLHVIVSFIYSIIPIIIVHLTMLSFFIFLSSVANILGTQQYICYCSP